MPFRITSHTPENENVARSADRSGRLREGRLQREPVGGGPQHGPVAVDGDQASRRARGPARGQPVSPDHTPAVDHGRRPQLPRIRRTHSQRIRCGEQQRRGRSLRAARDAAAQRAVSFGTRHIAPLLAEFSRRHPKLQVELGLNDRVVDLAEEGWDLAGANWSSRRFQL